MPSPCLTLVFLVIIFMLDFINFVSYIQLAFQIALCNGSRFERIKRDTLVKEKAIFEDQKLSFFSTEVLRKLKD